MHWQNLGKVSASAASKAAQVMKTRNARPAIIRTETPYTAHHYGRCRTVTRATLETGEKRIIALCDIITIDGRKVERIERI